MLSCARRAGILAACAGLAATAHAQVAPEAADDVAWHADSGPVAAKSRAPQVVYRTTVFIPGAAWLRLRFGTVQLPGPIEEGRGSFLRITSLQDGAVQYLNAESARQWASTSAYFNGDAVLVELIASPGVGPSRVSIVGTSAGRAPAGGADTICGPADDRTLITDNRAARHSIGCTSWMINDTNRQFLTAGHCGAAAGQVMSFNVPLSTSTGALVASAPQDQYVVDAASTQGNGGQGVGNDYCYFGVFPNSNTGLMPAQAYGAWYTLALVSPPVLGQTTRVTGFGVVSAPVSLTYNQAEKTHTGLYAVPTTGAAGTTVAYVVDTTGGNSGSPVTDETGGGLAIGIHTHGGCSSTGGQNYGTAIQLPGLQTALNNPLSACKTGRGTPAGALYAVGDGANNLGTCSPATGAFAKVAFAPPRMEGLTYNWNTGLFFAVSNDTYGVPPGPAGRKLWTIDPATGAATYIANISGAPGIINGLGYNPWSSALYGVIQATGTRVYINPATGVASIDGVANGGSIGALEYDPNSNTLYGIDDGGGASRLVMFTPDTGTAISIGPLGAGIADCNGLAVTDDGSLWTINAATDQLLRIDRATGAATVIGPTNGQFGASFGMAAILTPPATCYANCDASTIQPVLNVLDFSCFLNRFAAGDPYANCDNSTTPPVLNVLDFSCFLNRFATGCS